MRHKREAGKRRKKYQRTEGKKPRGPAPEPRKSGKAPRRDTRPVSGELIMQCGDRVYLYPVRRPLA